MKRTTFLLLAILPILTYGQSEFCEKSFGESYYPLKIGFEKHTDHAIKFSEIGLEIANNHKDWFAYKKSLNPKMDYVKWVGVGIAGLSLIWNIYQGITNSKLRDDNRILGDEIEALEKENAGLEQLLKKAQE
ncbi:hypothetical protein [Winogradskyella sp.]|uniref:hypothetical protein n=1 Tax=Winogradskyella sp. TaxID=1883156 RepID=UPI00261F53B9|nr:hypothetical protein [Winogradskyella sp.]